MDRTGWTGNSKSDIDIIIYSCANYEIQCTSIHLPTSTENPVFLMKKYFQLQKTEQRKIHMAYMVTYDWCLYNLHCKQVKTRPIFATNVPSKNYYLHISWSEGRDDVNDDWYWHRQWTAAKRDGWSLKRMSATVTIPSSPRLLASLRLTRCLLTQAFPGYLISPLG